MRVVAVLVVLSACKYSHGALSSDAPVGDGLVDSPLVDARPADAWTWGTPAPVTFPGPVAIDDDPTLTSDLLELYVNRNGDVYFASRASTQIAWPAPTLITQVSSAQTETTPEVSYDGLRMIVSSNRTGSQMMSQDLYESTRSDRQMPWGTPLRIVELCSDYGDYGGNVTPDGLMIVFTSFRKANLSSDVYYATRAVVSDPWSTPIEVTAVNTDGHEGSPFVTSDKLTLYFDTDRDGDLDIYFSQRASTSDPFPAPTKLTELSTVGPNEEDPWLSPDGRRMFYTSTASGSLQLWEAAR